MKTIYLKMAICALFLAGGVYLAGLPGREVRAQKGAVAVPQFAAVGRILNPELATASDADAAAQCCVEMDLLLQRIGLWIDLDGLGVPASEFDALADQSLQLPDYRNNPRTPTRDEIRALLDQCRVR